AREAPRSLGLPLAEAGEGLEHALERARHLARVRAQVGAEAQVLEHGHLREDAAALGYVGDAEGGDLTLSQRVDGRAAEADGSRTDGLQARDGLDEARLAGSVRADDGRDRSLGDPQGGAVDRTRLAVGDLDLLDVEH